MWLSKVQALSWTHSPVILKMLETGVLLHAEQKNLKASVPIGYLYYSGKTSSPQGAKIFGAPLQPSRQNGTAPLSRGEKRDMLDTSETEKGNGNSATKEAKFYFKYVNGNCTVTTIEVPNAI